MGIANYRGLSLEEFRGIVLNNAMTGETVRSQFIRATAIDGGERFSFGMGSAPATLLPASITHTRAQGALSLVAKISPAGQSHTRGQGSLNVATGARPAGLAHTRAQGASKVSPKLQPVAFSHTRAQGTITVAPSGTTISVSGLARDALFPVGNLYPSADLYPGSSRALVAPAVSTVSGPASLIRSRALGAPALLQVHAVNPAALVRTRTQGALQASPQLRPFGLQHSRVVGSPAVTTQTIRRLGQPTVTVAWHPRLTGLNHGRQQGSATAHGKFTLATDSLVRVRAQGTPTLTGRTTPTSLTHVRALGFLLVNQPHPAALSHTRAQGAPVLSIVYVARLTANVRIRATGSTTIRGALTIGPASIARTRAQGTPVLSGHATPTSLVHTRFLGVPAVNVSHLAPLALARA